MTDGIDSMLTKQEIKEFRDLKDQIKGCNSLKQAKPILQNHRELIDTLNQKCMNSCDLNSDLNELYQLIDGSSQRSFNDIQRMVSRLYMEIRLGGY